MTLVNPQTGPQTPAFVLNGATFKQQSPIGAEAEQAAEAPRTDSIVVTARPST